LFLSRQKKNSIKKQQHHNNNNKNWIIVYRIYKYIDNPQHQKQNTFFWSFHSSSSTVFYLHFFSKPSRNFPLLFWGGNIYPAIVLVVVVAAAIVVYKSSSSLREREDEKTLCFFNIYPTVFFLFSKIRVFFSHEGSVLYFLSLFSLNRSSIYF